MIDCRYPPRVAPLALTPAMLVPAPATPITPPVIALRPMVNRLADAWTLACATDQRVAAIAAQCPRLRPVAVAGDDWVLQGLTDASGVVAVCINAEGELSIYSTTPGARPAAIRLPLPIHQPEQVSQ